MFLLTTLSTERFLNVQRTFLERLLNVVRTFLERL